MDADILREKIIRSLLVQGFRIQNGTILPPENLSKNKIRQLHKGAVEYRIKQARNRLFRIEENLLRHIAAGPEVDPWQMSPRLVEVQPGSEEALLFRYISLHWSIPVSSGYGRRLRFLVIDDNNGKLVGLIGLGDPVYSLRPRDEWIGWTSSDREKRLGNIMDAFVLGAVPPYSFLLCGKLVAMLAASDTVRDAFRRKYGGKESIIRCKRHDGRLAMITTMSALGRSSIYNRLRFGDRFLYHSVGFTRGSGEFHFSDDLYGEITEFVKRYCKPTAKQKRWGTGFRNRREVVGKCLSLLGLSSSWAYHGIKREIFVIPLAHNTREFLQGQHARLSWYSQTEAQLFEYFRDRWMLRRARWDNRFRTFDPKSYRIWQRDRR